MSRKVVVIGFFIFLFGLGWGMAITSLRSQPISQVQRVQSTPQPSAPGLIAGMQNEVARVVRVIDGDTIELEGGRKVRYIGIDTPESVDPRQPVQCFGKEAAEINKEWVFGKEVRLEKDVSETDRYGRLLRYVYVKIGETELLVNEGLVREGFAHSSSYPPDVKYQERLRLAEEEAREVGRGLWSECPVESSIVPSVSEGNPVTTQVRGTTETKSEGEPQGSSSSGCVIKGNISSAGDKIYHLPGCGSYAKTSIDEARGERWFCNEAEAVGAGWRKAKNC